MTDLLYNYLITVEEVEGMWAELGVFRGETFKQFVAQGQKVHKYVIGVDSFRGMAEPTKEDDGYYPKGKLNSGGCKELISDLSEASAIRGEDYDLFEGYIPEVFKKIEAGWIYSFCYIDLDQYMPTKEAINFIWPQLNIGGLILFDDFLESRDRLATKAILEFLRTHSHEVKIEEKGINLVKSGCRSQLLIRKIQ